MKNLMVSGKRLEATKTIKPFIVFLIFSLHRSQATKKGVFQNAVGISDHLSVVPVDEPTQCLAEDWPNFFCFNRPKCFTMQQTCDGHDDCGDASDECKSLCSQTFQCQTGDQCIAMNQFCDGRKDCSDNSDEMEEEEEGFSCGNAWRIMSTPILSATHWKEQRVSVNPHLRFLFNQSYFTKKCRLPSNLVCDGINHCGDHSDECNNNCDSTNKFICKNQQCISKRNHCDGRDDCGDGSDECNPICKKYFLCENGACIALNKYCDGEVDCEDGSDEITDSTAPLSNYFNENLTCSNIKNFHNRRCLLPSIYVCDGVEHCLNREDECTESCANGSYSFLCKNGKCISDTKKCDGWDDCGDMSDECGVKGCHLTFHCNNGTCLSLDRFCNGVLDCLEGEDEDSNITSDGLFCSSVFSKFVKSITFNTIASEKKVCRLPARYICDNIEHCYNRVDENTESCKNSFTCNKGATVLPRESVCNGVDECSDHADEPYLIKPDPANQRGFKCIVMRSYGRQDCVLPQDFVNDTMIDCLDASDLCLEAQDGIDVNSCTTCLIDKKTVISKRQLCDGIFDCPDLSDECLCQTENQKEICQHIHFHDHGSPDRHCPCGEVPCLMDLSKSNSKSQVKCVKLASICDGVSDCDKGEDEQQCGLQSNYTSGFANFVNLHENDTFPKTAFHSSRIACPVWQPDNEWTPQYAIMCDNTPECIYMEDECKTNYCGESLPSFCSFQNSQGFFECPNGEPIPGRLVCNGVADCVTGEDESSHTCPGRVMCKSGYILNVKTDKKCNFIPDCMDGSDEENCSSTTHFYCESRSSRSNQTLFVRARQVMDGKEDCEDGSDECPATFLSNSIISSRHYVIKNPFLQVMVWVMGLIAFIGNSCVAVYTVGLLRHSARFKLTKVAVVYNCLVLNLSVADFLMSIYLIALGIVNVSCSGSYCRRDRFWRSSALCQGLGVLMVTSSEASLLTLLLLSAYRLYCVLRPIQSRTLKIHNTLFLVICIWGFAGTVALLPIITYFEDYFVTDIWVPNNVFFDSDVITKPKLTNFIMTLSNYSANIFPGDYDWNHMIWILQNFEPSYNIKGYFGYYSADATCLPRLFMRKGDMSWEYSLGIILLNFVIGITITLIYVLIWRPRQVNKTATSSQGTKNMQRKIALLIITDCACWFPICIVAFLCFSGVSVNNGVYVFTAIILLPFNSSLNPLFYSNVLQNLCIKAGNSFLKSISTKQTNHCVTRETWPARNKKNKAEDVDVHLLQDVTMKESPLISRPCSRLATEHTYVDSSLITESTV
ncbi:uncharacterized protein LOC143450419 [Clavelina lepadiformis]|uniref:uncharacterized protein LOC143450419 n=1 Tax=Clavelina lepadiformis TaxID=159417 RepID=UPI0040414F1B